MTHQRPSDRRRPGGFTLVELLVTVSIMAILLAILLPAFALVRREANQLVCLNNLRAAAFQFRLFTDSSSRPDRGDSDRLFAPRFSAWDFQESLYRAAEFWRTDSDIQEGRRWYRRGRDPMLCGALPSGLSCVSPGFSLESGRAVAPARLVGYAMNRRLVYAPFTVNGFQSAKFVTISERILDHPNVPLFFDVDAAAAVARWGDRGPFFSAPPGQTPGIYDGTPSNPHPYWFPARRHGGKVTVNFVDGHVVATADPLADSRWDWEYHPPFDP